MLLKKDLSQCKDLRTVEHLAQQFGWYATAWTPQEPHLICSDEQFTEFAKALPKDAVILPAGCAKYKYNKLTKKKLKHNLN